MDLNIEAGDATRGSREWKALQSRVLGIQLELRFLKIAVLYRKYAVDQPRIPAGSPEGGRWTRLAISVPGGNFADDSADERVRVAQNGPFRWTGARVTSRISGRPLEGTPGQFTQFAVINAQAAAATRASSSSIATGARRRA